MTWAATPPLHVGRGEAPEQEFGGEGQHPAEGQHRGQGLQPPGQKRQGRHLPREEKQGGEVDLVGGCGARGPQGHQGQGPLDEEAHQESQKDDGNAGPDRPGRRVEGRIEDPHHQAHGRKHHRQGQELVCDVNGYVAVDRVEGLEKQGREGPRPHPVLEFEHEPGERSGAPSSSW